MKPIILLLGMLALLANVAVADDMSDVKAAEIRLWEAWHHHDLNTWVELTSPDYVWSDGRDLRDYASVRKTFDSGTLQDYRTSEMHAVKVAPDVIVLSYRAHMKGVYEKKPFESDVAEGSVWIRRKGQWRNLMLQEVEVSGKETQVVPTVQP